MSKQQLLADIVSFLSKEQTSNEISSDEKESLELAIDCIKETFKVSTEGENDLLSLYTNALKSGSSAAQPETNTKISAEDEAKANELKGEGNKLMAARQFQEAVEKYTGAIDLNPTNPMFYANRAAAYSYLSLPERAVEDASKAVELDPTYSKAYSRLGHALWSKGDIKGAYDAYAKGLEAEGDNPSDAMKRDYESVKKRYEEMTKQDEPVSASNTDIQEREAGATGENSDAGADAKPAGGFPGFDMGALAGLMNNPQMKQMANQFMSDPSMMAGLMNSPMAQKLKQGGMPGMGDIAGMMQDENIQKMMKNFQNPGSGSN